MNVTNVPNTPSAINSYQDGPGLQFNMVLLFDEEVAASESRRIMNRLLAKCMPGLDIHRDELSFLEVSYPQLQNEAAELSAECDLFVLATINGEKLPAPVTAWLNLWLESRAKKETALVCLVGSPEGTHFSGGVHEHLQRLAIRHDLTFLPTSFCVRPAEMGARDASRVEQFRGEHHLFEYLPRPEGWGINE